MCKYCESGVNILNPIDGGLGIQIGLENGQNLKVLVAEKRILVKINYCPVCGRHLDGKKLGSINLIHLSRRFLSLPEKIKTEIKKSMYPSVEIGNIQFIIRARKDGKLRELKNIVEEKKKRD